MDGNPLEELEAVTDQSRLHVIMKDGKIYKHVDKEKPGFATGAHAAPAAHPTSEL